MHRLLVALSVASSASLVALGPPAASAGIDLGDPVPSTVEGLPVPEIAVVDPDLHTDNGAGTASETYRLPEGTRVKALRRWYTEELPIGHAFGDWSWCESVKTRIVLQRTWVRGDADILVLLLRSERNASPVILVGTLKEDTTDYGCEILPIERAAARAVVCQKMYQFNGDLPTSGAPVTRETIKRVLEIASSEGDAELSVLAANLGDPPTAEGIQNFLNWCASQEFTL